MLETREIPYLIRLLDDESPEIREPVLKELDSFGDSLEGRLVEFEDILDDTARAHLAPILEKHRRLRIKRNWLSWLDLNNDHEQLEAAYDVIADFQFGSASPVKLGAELDRLTDEYTDCYAVKDVFKLAQFLFEKKNIQGTRSDYYNPKNSNLVYVLSEKRGIPISLASLYMLVGQRLGLNIEGCNFPGHFLARTRSGGKLYWVDCFDRGLFFGEEDIFSMIHASSLDHYRLLHQFADATVIIERVLRNLIRAYQQTGDRDNAYFVLDLLQALTNETTGHGHTIEQTVDGWHLKAQLFTAGQLVKHKTYGYRGVVVDSDTSCEADSLWFHSNQTQPNRDQPWYRVLVHNAAHTTYAAQSNLECDDSAQPIEHPLLHIFFSGFNTRGYTRNDVPWAG